MQAQSSLRRKTKKKKAIAETIEETNPILAKRKYYEAMAKNPGQRYVDETEEDND